MSHYNFSAALKNNLLVAVKKCVERSKFFFVAAWEGMDAHTWQYCLLLKLSFQHGIYYSTAFPVL